MTTAAITIDQLAQMYQAANAANSDMSAAMRDRPRNPALIEQLQQRSRELNSAYAAAKRRYKRQQKSEQRDAMRSTMIRFYLDAREAA